MGVIPSCLDLIELEVNVTTHLTINNFHLALPKVPLQQFSSLNLTPWPVSTNNPLSFTTAHLQRTFSAFSCIKQRSCGYNTYQYFRIFWTIRVECKAKSYQSSNFWFHLIKEWAFRYNIHYKLNWTLNSSSVQHFWTFGAHLYWECSALKMFDP